MAGKKDPTGELREGVKGEAAKTTSGNFVMLPTQNLYHSRTLNNETNLRQVAAIDAYKQLMAASENIRRTGLNAEDIADIYLLVTLNLVLATSWRDDVAGFLREAAEEYDSEVAESFRELHLRIEVERL